MGLLKVRVELKEVWIKQVEKIGFFAKTYLLKKTFWQSDIFKVFFFTESSCEAFRVNRIVDNLF